MSLFKVNLRQHCDLFEEILSIEPSVDAATKCIVESLALGGKILLCGNGGSAADSQHIAAEFTGRFILDRKPIAAIALSTDTSALTCIGNDYSFDNIFSRQLLALARSGDILVAISTSGNSMNVINAVNVAREIGVVCIGLLGKGGGKLSELCDISIIIPSDITARIQEAHIFVGHTICGDVEKDLGLV